MKTWVTQIRKGVIEYCILNVLARGETYGYDIVQQLKKVEEMAITESTVYPILSRLKQDECLKVRVAPSLEGPPRRYFSLTETGRRRLREMNEYWEALNGAIHALQTEEVGHEVR